MINLKTKEEIEIMKEGGKRLKRIVTGLLPKIKKGITTKEIDEEAEKLIKDEGAGPSFKKVKNYYYSTCLPINEQVVHTPPSSRAIKEGEILTVDIGLYYRKYHTDFATTIPIGQPDEETKSFLEAGKEALSRAIGKARVNNYLGEISQEIDKTIHNRGFFVIKQLTGHGIGRQLHEDPIVPGYLDQPINKTFKIKEGLVIAIEIIYSKGTDMITLEKGSDWSLITTDKSQSACFEHTVAVTLNGPEVLT